MPPRILVFPILGALVLGSGCLDATSPSLSTARPIPDGPVLGVASGLPLDARLGGSLEAPPEWRLGEWWKTRFSAPPYGLQAEFTQVVAGVHGDAYLLGVDAASFDDGVLLLHFPGLGEVDRATLGFDAHDLPFVPLRFPLREGATWETQWYTGAPLRAVVTRVAGSQADVELTGARTVRLTYDADLGGIRSLSIVDYGGYEIVDHGYGYHGPVLVPSGQDLVFCHGRATLVQAVSQCKTLEATNPQTPTERLVLKEGYDRVSFGLFLRDLQTAPVGPGLLHIDVVAPDGQRYTATKTPDRPGMVLHPYGLDDPAGTWEVTAVAAGAGLAILEGVAYRSLETTL